MEICEAFSEGFYRTHRHPRAQAEVAWTWPRLEFDFSSDIDVRFLLGICEFD